ncbi:MAG: hypothetical protein COV79_05070 [Parcubacteria group bacterium CG11_big_fil_rev_8_21_14_0_20_41_14]|nr:MAG: hypothetical protein COV79_05070 [Parcubacteria group bacterium CG11_big_fil_rev_8_21_14_0_20_41_14]
MATLEHDLDLEWSQIAEACEAATKNGNSPEKVIDCLFKTQIYAENHLAEHTEKEFGHRLILDLLANEFLKCSIEDDHVKFDHSHLRLIKAFWVLLKDSKWVSKELKEFVQAYRDIVTDRITDHQSIEFQNKELSAEFLLSLNDKLPFNVSTHLYHLLTILDRNLSNPAYVGNIEQKFLDKLENKKDINSSVFR